ncbi:hypothetical protein PF008_g15112 [Phytophthora fragariae]|uniref:Uncharacterized protein n=1 Tax=Phytophthora fragariae TaxID=53985 RepID=A0A6G0RGE4_9STRA|nr:hypothetical protein PF008_g15112 [Phytophthora fragariae]
MSVLVVLCSFSAGTDTPINCMMVTCMPSNLVLALVGRELVPLGHTIHDVDKILLLEYKLH